VTSLSTHVLDTGEGRPAAGVRVELFHDGDLVASGTTDADGRIAQLATGLEAGGYELVFHPQAVFFTRIALRVELADGHYHVPLLTSPYSCASYRGS